MEEDLSDDEEEEEGGELRYLPPSVSPAIQKMEGPQ